MNNLEIAGSLTQAEIKSGSWTVSIQNKCVTVNHNTFPQK